MRTLPGPVVSAEWLERHRRDVVVADVRWYLDGRSGRDAHAAGHIPGAVWIDVDRDLSAPASPTQGRHPLPTPEHFASALATLGIADDAPVVAYDDAGGSIAARLWWMLHAIGQPAAVLDGGIGAWTGELSRDAPAPAPASVTRAVRPWPPSRFVDANAVDGLRGSASALVLDARARARYERGDDRIDPRPGHVSGAINAPWVENLDENGWFHSPAVLRARFVDLGAVDVKTVVAYCGSGVTACHDLLALELAGLGGVAVLYPGSWSQWGADPSRPATVGSDRG
jgi:thiosulfate/3-mercaptopyruvate sulfurtransferase